MLDFKVSDMNDIILQLYVKLTSFLRSSLKIPRLCLSLLWFSSFLCIVSLAMFIKSLDCKSHKKLRLSHSFPTEPPTTLPPNPFHDTLHNKAEDFSRSQVHKVHSSPSCGYRLPCDNEFEPPQTWKIQIQVYLLFNLNAEDWNSIPSAFLE